MFNQQEDSRFFEVTDGDEGMCPECGRKGFDPAEFEAVGKAALLYDVRDLELLLCGNATRWFKFDNNDCSDGSFGKDLDLCSFLEPGGGGGGRFLSGGGLLSPTDAGVTLPNCSICTESLSENNRGLPFPSLVGELSTGMERLLGRTNWWSLN